MFLLFRPSTLVLSLPAMTLPPQTSVELKVLFCSSSRLLAPCILTFIYSMYHFFKQKLSFPFSTKGQILASALSGFSQTGSDKFDQKKKKNIHESFQSGKKKMGEKKKSFVLAPFFLDSTEAGPLSRNVPGRLIAKSRYTTLIADCKFPPAKSDCVDYVLHSFTHVAFPFFSPPCLSAVRSELPAIFQPSYKVGWIGDTAGKNKLKKAKQRQSQETALTTIFHLPTATQTRSNRLPRLN